MACVFCDRDPAAGELVFENRFARLFLHPDSAVRGHAMVVSLRHVENLCDLTEREALDFARLVRAAERVLLEATGTGRAVLMKLGLLTPHLHVHIYPVSASLDRAAVMQIIDAAVSEPRHPGFADDIRDRLRRLTSRPE